MTIESILILLIIGAIAGWLAAKLIKGGGFGLAGNIVVGIIGAIIGRWVFSLLGITAGSMLGTILMATIGAAILLFLIGLFKK